MANDLQNRKAPSFTLSSSENTPISLKDFKGKIVVVFFYPKDNTSGCSIEAQSFKEKYWEFNDLDVVILGISPDDLKSHAKFIKKYDLPYPLLSDFDHQTAENYQVWVQKTAAGHDYWGIERSTFIIDGEGIIRQVVQQVKPDEHPLLALESIKKLLPA